MGSVITCVCDFVCLSSVHALKEKQLELSAPKSVESPYSCIDTEDKKSAIKVTGLSKANCVSQSYPCQYNCLSFSVVVGFWCETQSKLATCPQRAEFKVYCTFQSHEPEFDYLKSLEIEEKINALQWLRRSNPAHFLLTTNGLIALFTYFLSRVRTIH